jgi:hypothetical protein
MITLSFPDRPAVGCILQSLSCDTNPDTYGFNRHAAGNAYSDSNSYGDHHSDPVPDTGRSQSLASEHAEGETMIYFILFYAVLSLVVIIAFRRNFRTLLFLIRFEWKIRHIKAMPKK